MANEFRRGWPDENPRIVVDFVPNLPNNSVIVETTVELGVDSYRGRVEIGLDELRGNDKGVQTIAEMVGTAVAQLICDEVAKRGGFTGSIKVSRPGAIGIDASDAIKGLEAFGKAARAVASPYYSPADDPASQFIFAQGRRGGKTQRAIYAQEVQRLFTSGQITREEMVEALMRITRMPGEPEKAPDPEPEKKEPRKIADLLKEDARKRLMGINPPQKTDESEQ